MEKDDSLPKYTPASGNGDTSRDSYGSEDEKKPLDPPPYRQNGKNLDQHNRAFPTQREVKNYLRVLEAFWCLKKSFLLEFDKFVSLEISSTAWTNYVLLAVRRFTIYVSSLRWKFKEETTLFEFMDLVLPPMDVLLIWHTICLKPKSFRENFEYNDFILFWKYGFPLETVAAAIHEKSLMINVLKQAQDKVESVVGEYLKSIDDDGVEFKYNEYDTLFYTQQVQQMPIYCPLSNEKVGDFVVEFTPICRNFTKSEGGKFQTNPPCGCWGTSDIVLLIGCYKTRACQMVQDLIESKNPKKNHKIPSMLTYDSLETIRLGKQIEYLKKQQLISDLKLKEHSKDTVDMNYMYLEMISCLIPGRDKIVIRDALVNLTLRVQKFIDQIHNLKWYLSDTEDLEVSRAIERYKKFYSLQPTMCKIATLDIEVVWHAHLLRLAQYYADCKQDFGTLVDHPDFVRVSRVHELYFETCKRYRKKYGEDMSGCQCKYCRNITRESQSWRQKSSSNKNTISNALYSLQHYSNFRSIYTVPKYKPDNFKNMKYTEKRLTEVLNMHRDSTKELQKLAKKYDYPVVASSSLWMALNETMAEEYFH